MKLTLVNNKQGNSGGQEIFAQELLFFLNKNLSTQIVTQKNSKDPFKYLDRSTRKIELATKAFFDDQIILPNELSKVLMIINKSEVLIINNPLSLFAQIFLILNLRRKKIITIFHGKNYSANPVKNLLLTIRKSIYVTIANIFSRKLVFLTKEDEIYFRRKTFFQQESTVISNGVDLKLFRPAVNKDISSNKLNVLFIGRLTKEKGVEDLISAAKKINSNFFHFNFIGDGPLRDTIKKQENCNTLGTKNRKEIAELLRKHDLFILPSHSECFPLTLLEAMASGLPVIATNIFGITKIAPENANMFFEPGNIEEIKKCLMHYWNNKKLIKNDGKINREHSKKFKKKTSLSSYLDLITNI